VPPRSSRTEPGLDVLRGLLVLAMFAVHARRLQPGFTRSGTAADRALDAMMWAEPLIAAGFLFVVGTSLALSQRHFARGSGGPWRRKLLSRAALLYALGIALFVPQYGVGLPDLLLSPGILSAIAIAIAVVGLALDTPRPLPLLAAIAGGGLALTALLDWLHIGLSGVNSGPGGALPLLSFTAAGAALELLRQRNGTRALLGFFVSALPALALALASGMPWTTTRDSYYADHGGLLALPGLLAGAEPARRLAVGFWNHSALGALGLLAPLGLVLLVALGSPQRLAGSRPIAPLRLLGRHALAAYVLHLAALGLVEIAGLSPAGALTTWALVGALALLGSLAALALDWRRTQGAGSA
jgi:uncharacterized membrane protein YcfT